MKLSWQRFVERVISNNHRLVLGLTSSLLICIWSFVGFWSWWEHHTLLASQGLILEQLTAAVHAQTKGLFKQAESLLIVTDQWISDHPDLNPETAPEFIALVERLRAASDGMLDFRLVTDSARLRFVPHTDQPENIDVSDRDYVRAQFDAPKGQKHGLYIGQPVLGRASKKWSIPVSMPVSRPGSPIALLLTVIELDRMSGTFEPERIKPAGTIGIARSDGIVVFRSPLDEKAIGNSLAKGEAWKKYMSIQAKGTYESHVSIFDQAPRLVSFSKLNSYPLVVYVSASKNDVLQPWRTHTTILSLVAALVSMAGLAMISALARAMNATKVYEAIVQSTEDAIVGKSLEGIITSWNPGAERMFGYAESDMLGQSILRLLPADRSNEEAAILNKIKAGEVIRHFETIRVCKDGRQINVSVTISPIRDKFGKLTGASKIARNITEMVQATQQLRLTASVFTNTSEGILITDSQGSIVEVNEAFSKISGYTRAQVIGQSPLMFRSSRQGPETFKSLVAALAEHGEWRGELWSRRQDGEAYSVWLTVTKVKEPTGEVSHYVALFSDITALKLQQEELDRSAHFDGLTDLPNRLLLSDRLHQAMTMSLRHGHSLAVLYLDLDGFKAINDRYGHKVGDELLIAVSKRMKAALRDVDTLARMGGDEFVAVLTDIHTPQDCVQLVTRVLNACAESAYIQGNALRVTASIGVTLFPQDNADADQLMRHADQAMYEAKQSGKNRFHMFDSAQDAELKSRNVQQERIADALERQEFVLYYQPKVNMRTGAIVGAEALIRWQHPDKGLLPPGAFLPAVENHPLNAEIGSWVLATALQQMGLWKKQGLVLPVSVNVAARQLQKENFVGHLSELLSNHPDVDANCLELEVLETSALDDITSTATVMQDCHRLGVRFAIDDFGTGYSSLTYLRHLPVETLKIDQSFVRDMLDDQSDLSIVNGVIGLAHAFHREVIAEGVETSAHGKRLIELGCDLAQGYRIARPMPADQVIPWCTNWVQPPEWT